MYFASIRLIKIRSELTLPHNPLLICSLALLVHIEQYNEWQLFVSTAVYKQILDVRKCIMFCSIIKGAFTSLKVEFLKNTNTKSDS